MAIYFPQFHEVEENNKFWGQGFTEWNLINNYKGDIKKPHIDIGQYNILDNSTRRKQAAIAKDHGIDSFCYYHYWFKDKKVMYRGIEKILEDGEPNIPFTLCWANEPWTRNWDGLNNDVLLEQDYGNINDWEEHYKYLSRFFKHKNYIKRNNSPIIYIYRLEHIIKNNALNMLNVWKKLAKLDGFNDLIIISVMGSWNNYEYYNGFAEHQPNCLWLTNRYHLNFYKDKQANYDILHSYNKLLLENKPCDKYIRGLFYSFDNSSRRINNYSAKFINLNYKYLENMLIKTIYEIDKTPNVDNNYILINSWNEWAEQAMIEPNDHDGYEIIKIFKKYFIN